jgi:phospholipase C
MESPQYRRGALFIVYDEWGGFFDHVAPPRVPDQLGNRDPNEDWGQMGFRIPAVVVSPYARAGRVSHATLGFESIIKLITYRFGLGSLNRRHKYAYNIGRTMQWDRPRFEPPALPDPQVVATSPCGPPGFPGARSAAATRPKPHDLTLLETTGYLDRLGFDVADATYDRIYRNPDSFRKALAQSR